MLSLWIGLAFLITYFLGSALVSPLSGVPGPWYTRLTSLWIKYREFTGTRRAWVHYCDQKYGPVVRLGPNEVSFTSYDAVKEIYILLGEAAMTRPSTTISFDNSESSKSARARSRGRCAKRDAFRTMFSTLCKDEASRPRGATPAYADGRSIARESASLRKDTP